VKGMFRLRFVIFCHKISGTWVQDGIWWFWGDYIRRL